MVQTAKRAGVESTPGAIEIVPRGATLGAEIRTRVCVLLGVDGRHLDDQSKDYAPKRPNAILDQTLFHSYCSILKVLLGF